MVHTSPVHTAKGLWKRTDLTLADFDFAELYDGFSIIVFQWLEALGFCMRASRARSSPRATRDSVAPFRSTPTVARATSVAGTAPTSASRRPASCAGSAARAR